MTSLLSGCTDGRRRRSFRKPFLPGTFLSPGILLPVLFSLLTAGAASAQTCPTGTTITSITSFPNTYFAGGFGFLGADITFPIGTTTLSIQGSTTGYQGAGANLAVGDVILIIQMQGAGLTTANNITYGDGATGAGYSTAAPFVAGLMEFATVSGLGLGTITLASGTTNAYRSETSNANGNYRFQIIKVNPFTYASLGANITPPAWNGDVGGVVVLSITKTLDWNGKTIDASGKGFRGGGGRRLTGAGGASNADYRFAATSTVHGAKGEGLAGTPRYLFDAANSTTAVTNNGVEGYPNGSNARGGAGNAGGGGTDGSPTNNSENSGGGGGGNAGVGGKGGNTWSSNLGIGGLGGKNFAEVVPNRLVMGGGGGAGSTNDGTGTPANGVASSGATGGGIVIVIANATIGTGAVNVNGVAANSTVTTDGDGGGGAGGSVMMFVTNVAGLANVSVTAAGGAGGSNIQPAGTTAHGPGGGGGGGVIYTNGGTLASTNVAGGANGTTTTTIGGVTTSIPYGSTSGLQGFYLNTTTTANIPTNTRQCQVIALPVTLVDFSGTLKDDNSVALAWHTSEEINFSHFVVERSTDAVSFAPLGDITADSGAAQTRGYGYSDPLASVAGEFFYYRLKMLDADNSFAYSKTVLIRRNGSNAAFAMYPNPVGDHLQFDINVTVAGRLEYKVMDNAGRILQEHSTVTTKGKSSVVVSGLNKFAPGNYILQVRSGSQVYTRKVIKQ